MTKNDSCVPIRLSCAGVPVMLGEDLLDEVAAFCPIDIRTFETEYGTGAATWAEVLRVESDGSVTDFGERPIFWVVVRKQLRRSSRSSPWVVGRLVRSNRAYKLQPLGRGESRKVAAALDRFHACNSKV